MPLLHLSLVQPAELILRAVSLSSISGNSRSGLLRLPIGLLLLEATTSKALLLKQAPPRFCRDLPLFSEQLLGPLSLLRFLRFPPPSQQPRPLRHASQRHGQVPINPTELIAGDAGETLQRDVANAELGVAVLQHELRRRYEALLALVPAVLARDDVRSVVSPGETRTAGSK